MELTGKDVDSSLGKLKNFLVSEVTNTYMSRTVFNTESSKREGLLPRWDRIGIGVDQSSFHDSSIVRPQARSHEELEAGTVHDACLPLFIVVVDLDFDKLSFTLPTEGEPSFRWVINGLKLSGYEFLC